MFTMLAKLTGVRTACAAILIAALGPGAAAADTLDRIGCPAESVRIVVLGDSLADGLWGAFFRAFAGCSTVDLLRRTQVSDGLAKTDPEGWLARLGPEAEGADLVVVQIGANDITNIREGTTRHVFGSDEWRVVYGARATALAEGLRSRAPRLIWMGLPIVGQERFEDSYREISALQEAAITAAGGRFVDTHEPTTFGGGEFVMNAQWDGSVRQMRISDQVHFTELGYDVVAGLLAGEVERLFQTRERAAAMDGLALQ
ncbi:DUF459 domain-containing protein [Roseisalinus antarcticus]|uniref:Uncharacterized protein n=1 Tax=Roseisalinus antarcticus TaxID=254357 RepID=A0A1Y5RIQ3_9RHOB|nr:GDSL-type esterase/lipase family protein [Roseisalinus antarcticus]SLN18510.1 hypothetical protein ROA7023_00397 [Roseisalinus antarcticus]